FDFDLGGCWRFHLQKLAALLELLLTMSVSQQAIVTNALHPLRQDVEQEATDELVGLEGHGLLGVAVPIVLPFESDLPVVDVQDAVVRDRHTVGVAADVVEDLFGSGKGGLGVNHPLLLSQGVQIVEECLALAQSLKSGEELKLAAVKGVHEQFQESAAEVAREHPHGEEETGAAGNPSLPVGGQSAARDHAVQMRVVGQSLPPGVQDGEEA